MRFRSGLLAILFGFFPALSFAAEELIVQSFRRDIQPVLQKYCYDCHGDGHEKGGVRLDDFADAAALRDHSLWLRAMKNIRSGLMPPAEEEHPLPAAEAEKIMAWIKREAFGLDPAKPDPGRVTVRRLNRIEYRNTIRDLLGFDYDTQKEFPADDTGHGFDNIADVLSVSPILLEKYLDAAQTIVTKTVPLQPRVVAEVSVAGRKFATVKVDTTIPEQPKPGATPPVESAAPVTTPPPARAPTVAAAGTPAAPGTPAVPGRGQGRGFGFGRTRTTPPPPPMTRPVPVTEGDSLTLSYYTPAVVSATHRVEHAGKYQLVFDLRTAEKYVDDIFDQNRCRLVIKADGETLLDRPFTREGSKEFKFTYDRTWAAGDHELSLEIVPDLPAQPQNRQLRLRFNAVTVRGPFDERHWVKPKDYAKIFPRDPPTEAAARRAYARELIEKFATRAFRRPPDATTLERLTALAGSIYAEPKNTFEGGVAQAMVAVLASPRFIFREEETEPLRPGQAHAAIDEYALASRLSYFFWSSMPDAELFRLAAEKKLRANLPAQVTRLLADPRANEFVRNFTGQWLQARDIQSVPLTPLDIYLRDHPNPALEEARATIAKLQSKPREARTPEESEKLGAARMLTFAFGRQPKPELTDKLRRAMQQETDLTFAHLVKEDRSVLELLESDYTFLNEDLAKHYGIPGVTGERMRKVTLPPDSPRGGVLTQGTVLAVTSNPTRTSPVKRGVFILSSILGTPPAPPPPNIPALEDAATPAKLREMTLRETLAVHAEKALCRSCHNRMDPLGLALENFNAMGVWREADVGQRVEPAGQLITGERFANIRELKHVLATARQRDFYYCFTEKLLTYALGRGLEYYDVETLDQLVAQLEASGGRPSALINGIVNSAAFQQRRVNKTALATSNSPAPRLPPLPRLVQAQP